MDILRSYYCKFRSRSGSVKIKKTKGGSGLSDIKKPNWPYFNSLKFLDGSLSVKGTSSSINLSDIPQFDK